VVLDVVIHLKMSRQSMDPDNPLGSYLTMEEEWPKSAGYQ